MSEFALEMRQISKTYGAVRANDAISLHVPKGTIHALAGENGAGKSTLMKILFGLVEPDRTGGADGGIFIRGKKVQFTSPMDAIGSGVGMVQQHFALAGALTALDNVILGAEPIKNGFIDRASASKILEALAGSELSVPLEKNVEDLSVGVQQRIEILKLLFRNAEILILDEPTAVLTPQEVEAFFVLLRRLRDQGKTIILITHKLEEVLSLCDNVTVLRQGRVVGEFPIKGLTREALVRSMIGRDVNPVKKDAPQVGEELLSCMNVSVHHSHRGSLKGFDCRIKKGEIVGIAGVEGNGQQALVESLLGLISFEGEIIYKNKSLPSSTKNIRESLNFGLISEDRHHQSLWLDASVTDNCVIGFTDKISKFGFLNHQKTEGFAKDILKPYKVKMGNFDDPIKSLSGGNQQKVVIAREVSARKPEFLIASQPTRGVDVGAIEFIHQQIMELRNSGSGVLLISSELEEICALSDRVIVIFEGRSVQEFSGPTYDVAKLGYAMTTGEAL